MAIDDPAFERALQQLQMEDLSKAPRLIRILGESGISVGKAIEALMEGNFSAAVSSFGEIHEMMAEDRSLYLLYCLNDDLKRLRGQVEQLTEQQQEYLKTDFVGLMLDADRKARETRAKSRIRRMSQILTSSVQMKPSPSPDDTEEMLRIAMDLSDQDVATLRALKNMHQHYEDNVMKMGINGLALAGVPGLTPEQVLGICGKLLSLGLIIEPEQRAKAVGGSYPRGGGYVLLPRGEAFLKFVRNWNQD